MSALRPAGAILAVLALLATAGCIGFVLGEEPLVYEANNATVDADNRVGFDLADEQLLEQNQTINRSGINRSISVTSYAGIYTKNETINTDEQRLASVAVVSTPVVDVFERPVNPIGNMSGRDMLEFLSEQTEDSQFEATGELERVPPDQVGPRTQDVTILGTETDIAVYRTTQNIEGRTVELRLYVTRVRHGDDYVVLFGGHSMLHPAEGYAIVDMMRSVEHDAED